MKTLVLGLLLFGLVLAVHSAIFMETQPELPGHPGECYDKETKTFYKAGEEMIWRKNECALKICRGSYRNRKVLTEIQTCGKVSAPDNCFVSNDLSEGYPNCCRIVCLDENNNEYNL